MNTDSTSDPAIDFFNRIEARDAARKGQDEPPKWFVKSQEAKESLDKDGPEGLELSSLPFREFSVGGTVRKFYEIGTVAFALGVKPVTIRSWQAKGWLPQNAYRTPPPRGEQVPGKAVKGRRLFTQEQLVTLYTEYNRYVVESTPSNWAGFRSAIKTDYPRS